jgi:hypothetical protein
LEVSIPDLVGRSGQLRRASDGAESIDFGFNPRSGGAFRSMNKERHIHRVIALSFNPRSGGAFRSIEYDHIDSCVAGEAFQSPIWWGVQVNVEVACPCPKLQQVSIPDLVGRSGQFQRAGGKIEWLERVSIPDLVGRSGQWKP